MIITKLIGGLGNQMFQYAIARQMALINNTQVLLDVNELVKHDDSVKYTPRNFELSIFNLQHHLYNSDKRSISEKIFDKLRAPLVLNENDLPGRGFCYDDTVLRHRSKNIYLNGFWQNEKYFKDAEPIIRNDFKIIAEISRQNLDLLDQIKSTNSVSIHFRRGDYLSLPSANNFHGVCSESYYQKAMANIKKTVKNPYYFIFSDDIGWVKSNITFDSQHTFISNNLGITSYEDMRLMSCCKHNIIANSSFSWWAAWLNENIYKIVIAPERWFKSVDTDIVPDKWSKI